MQHLLTIVLTLACVAVVSAQKTITLEGADETVRLWDNTTAKHSNYETRDEAWNNKRKTSMKQTSSCELYIFKADAAKNTGVALVICPGGGYSHLNLSRTTCRWLASQGITAALLKYRLPNGHKEVPLEDAMGAVRYIRTRTDLGIDPAKVGINGGSAGGHLAAWTSNALPDEEKPAFAILHYPAINRTDPLYIGTQNTTGHLLGMGFPLAEAEDISAHKMVTSTTPPTLIMLCDDDKMVPPTSPVAYYEALVRHGVQASLHIFPRGGHSLKAQVEEQYAMTLDWLDWLGLTKKQNNH